MASDLREVAAGLPNEPGVYRFRDADGAVLYVGKAKALRKRVSSYFQGGRAAALGPRLADMVARVAEIECVVTGTETEALLLEDNFIKEHRPPFNLRLRDDKSYPYIEVTLADEWPRVRFTRGKHVAGNLYFGPYSSARKVRETLELIGRIFPYRKCRGETPGRRSGTPCLQYFIGRSLAPCDARVTGDEYMQVVWQVVEFLRGRLGAVGYEIERQMNAASQARQYEKAAVLRNRLAAVRHVQERQTARLEGAGQFDVVAIHREDPGGNAQVLRVRDGLLVDRQTFYLENVADREATPVLEEFLLEYYGEGIVVPPLIVADLPGDTRSLEEILRARRGSRVEVRRAQRGPKRRLLEMAQRNAESAGRQEAERGQRSREGRREALERLRDALGLSDLPLRIECFDISNLGEANAVGSMVVFEEGAPRKEHYRKFAVRDVAGQDDFAMMREVVGRRFERGAESGGGGDGYDESFATLPNLVLVDGGKGQVSAAQAALRQRDIAVPLAGLAKRREEVFVPGRSAPLALARDDPASMLLQRVRDEAHRFALTFHRQRRGSDLTQSSIFAELPKVGPVRRRRILEYFGSPERFLAATRDELERVPGLPAKVAREIYAHLHKTG